MTVKELKEELEYYEDDMDIVFEVCDDFKVLPLSRTFLIW